MPSRLLYCWKLFQAELNRAAKMMTTTKINKLIKITLRFIILYPVLMPTSLRKSNETGNIHAGLNAYLIPGTKAVQEKILYQKKLGVS